MQATGHNDQRIALTGYLLRIAKSISLAFSILKFEPVKRLHICGKLFTPTFVEKNIEPAPCVDAHVMLAFGANIKILFQLRPVEYCITPHAFFPQALRH